MDIMKRAILISLLLAVSILCAFPAIAQESKTLTFNEVLADTYVKNTDTSQNPTETILTIRNDFLEPTASGIAFAYMTWDLSNFTCDNVVDADLKLRTTATVEASMDIDTHVALFGGNLSHQIETMVYANHSCGNPIDNNACNSTQEDRVTVSSTDTEYHWNITPAADLALGNGWNNLTLLIQTDSTADTGQDLKFHSAEAATESSRPTLAISCNTAPVVANFLTINAIDIYDSSSIQNFTVIIRNSTETYSNYTTSGSIKFTNITSGVYNISIINANDTGGYYDVNYSNWNYTEQGNLQANLTKYFRAFVTYSNYVEFNNTNFARNLTYVINATCPSFANVQFDRHIQQSFNGTNESFSCSDAYQQLSLYYQHPTEENYTISTLFNVSYRPEANNEFIGESSYLSDLNPPNITTLNFTSPEGFAPALTNLTMICTDKVQAANLTYDLQFNGNPYFYGNLSNATEQRNETSLANGDNVIRGVCSDFFSSTQKNLTKNIYKNVLYLIDEVDNTLFDVDNATGARVYFDNNRSFFDFKTQDTNQINFTTENDNQLRFELTYSDGSIVTRYVDVSLINGDIRVCANKEGITHYQQLIIAASQKPAILRNLFSDCVIAADYTRFAYQDALVLQAFSIASLYYLYTLDNDENQLFLASLDGSISTFVNLDQLEFGQTAYNLDLLQDSLTFEKTEDDEIQIYYNNIAADNTALSFSITRMDTSETVFSTSSFTNPNEFTLLFDYSTLSPTVNETVLFKAELTKTTAAGDSTITKYFNTNAQTGILRSIIAAVISILLTMFGLTIASARITFSWFGALITIAAIGVLTTAVMNWYILLLMGIEIIMLVYILIMTTTRNYPSIA